MHLTSACIVSRITFPNSEGARSREDSDIGGKGRLAAGECQAFCIRGYQGGSRTVDSHDPASEEVPAAQNRYNNDNGPEFQVALDALASFGPVGFGILYETR